jgi:hypothetical protein
VQLNHKLSGRSESATANTACGISDGRSQGLSSKGPHTAPCYTALIAHSLGASVSMSQGDPSARFHFIYVAIAGIGLPVWKFFIGEAALERQISVTRRRCSSEAKGCCQGRNLVLSCSSANKPGEGEPSSDCEFINTVEAEWTERWNKSFT